MTEKDSNIVSLQEMRRKLYQEKKRQQNPRDLRAELDYRTEKVLEFMDEQQRRIERLEANLRALVRILKNTIKKD